MYKEKSKLLSYIYVEKKMRIRILNYNLLKDNSA